MAEILFGGAMVAAVLSRELRELKSPPQLLRWTTSGVDETRTRNFRRDRPVL